MLSKRKLSRLKVSEIRELVDSAEPDPKLLKILESDSRIGVRALAGQIAGRRQREKELAERERKFMEMECDLHEKGTAIIAGLDEAGRGPLAGPVVAAAVVLPDDLIIPGLDDSKKLTPAKRDKLFDIITGLATAWGVGMVESDEIDHINILRATCKAMRTATANLGVQPDAALIDGNTSPGLSCREYLVIEGDGRCRSIAAASIIAKVMRDRIMIEMDEVYPGYGFARHKGYGSAVHRAAIAEHGPCDIHRFSFGIVPELAPAGTIASILSKRLKTAVTPESFDRTVAAIAKLKPYLADDEITSLRNIYSQRQTRF